jgi:molecular chaperone GrpE (heat shock protein)
VADMEKEGSSAPGPTPADTAQAAVVERLDAIAGQVTLLRHQVLQQLGGLGGLLGQQAAAVKAELDVFRTGGPKHAMAAVFHKLFRDLVGHMNALDEMADGHAVENPAAAEWQRAFQIARQRFESFLVDWGCEPIKVEIGRDQFDPDIHESIPAGDIEIPPGTEANVILAVKRRGWRLHGTIIQYPLVMVS